MKVSRTMKAALATATLASAVTVTGAGTAQAASWNGISGTVYSPCSSAGHAWFTSSTPRYKAGTGAVKVQFGHVNSGGLNFKIVGQSNQTIGQVVTFYKTETDITRTLSSSVANSTKFFNAFRQNSSACGQQDYNFSGSEYY